MHIGGLLRSVSISDSIDIRLPIAFRWKKSLVSKLPRIWINDKNKSKDQSWNWCLITSSGPCGVLKNQGTETLFCAGGFDLCCISKTKVFVSIPYRGNDKRFTLSAIMLAKRAWTGDDWREAILFLTMKRLDHKCREWSLDNTYEHWNMQPE